MRASLRQVVVVAPAALLLVACVAPEPIRPFEGAGPAWPPPPEPARVQFVRAFSSPGDLGIRPSLWNRIVGAAMGSTEHRMRNPMAVAATGSGEVVFVTDPGAGCVHRYDLARGRYDCLAAERGTALPSPVGLAVTADGRVFAADSALNAVLTAGPDDDALRPVSLSPPPEQPTGLALTPSGELFVASTASHSVRGYDAAGAQVRAFGSRGDAPGQMNFPTYLWFEPPGELLVTDTLNFRIQRLDVETGAVSVFGQAGDASGSLARPKGVAADRDGHVYVVDAMLHALQVFDRQGRLLLALGEQGQEPGQFWLPNGLFVTGGGLIFVADSYNRRVQVFRYLGDAP